MKNKDNKTVKVSSFKSSCTLCHTSHGEIYIFTKDWIDIDRVDWARTESKQRKMEQKASVQVIFCLHACVLAMRVHTLSLVEPSGA